MLEKWKGQLDLKEDFSKIQKVEGQFTPTFDDTSYERNGDDTTAKPKSAGGKKRQEIAYGKITPVVIAVQHLVCTRRQAMFQPCQQAISVSVHLRPPREHPWA
jgi:hypothetical protein